MDLLNKINQAKERLARGVPVVIAEPCDCGDFVRHNNGGNYHEVITIKPVGEKLFAKFSSTCELVDDEDWVEVDQIIVDEYAHWLD